VDEFLIVALVVGFAVAAGYLAGWLSNRLGGDGSNSDAQELE
jgi:hypothetical protein